MTESFSEALKLDLELQCLCKDVTRDIIPFSSLLEQHIAAVFVVVSHPVVMPGYLGLVCRSSGQSKPSIVSLLNTVSNWQDVACTGEKH